MQCDNCGADEKELVKLGVETSGRLPTEQWWCINCIKKRMTMVTELEAKVKELEAKVKELESIVGGDYKTYGLFYDMELMKKEFEDFKRMKR